MENVKIKMIVFTSDEMKVEAKAPPRKAEYCLMDDLDILPRDFLVALKKRIQYGIDKRSKPDPTGRD